MLQLPVQSQQQKHKSKMGNMFKVNNKDTRICKINNNVNNKVTVAVVLISLLLNLNIFHLWFQCYLNSLSKWAYIRGGWVVYACEAYTRDVNWTTYLGGIYSGERIYLDQINRILQCMKIVQLSQISSIWTEYKLSVNLCMLAE